MKSTLTYKDLIDLGFEKGVLDPYCYCRGKCQEDCEDDYTYPSFDIKVRNCPTRGLFVYTSGAYSDPDYYYNTKEGVEALIKASEHAQLFVKTKKERALEYKAMELYIKKIGGKIND